MASTRNLQNKYLIIQHHLPTWKASSEKTAIRTDLFILNLPVDTHTFILINRNQCSCVRLFVRTFVRCFVGSFVLSFFLSLFISFVHFHYHKHGYILKAIYKLGVHTVTYMFKFDN